MKRNLLPQKNRTLHMGFTLFEVMIVVAIIGILGLVAFPVFKHHSDQARFTEAILALGSYRVGIVIAAETGQFNSMLDIKEGVYGIPEKQTRTNTVHGIDLQNGEIRVDWKTDGSDLEGIYFTLTAQSYTPPIYWETGGKLRDRRVLLTYIFLEKYSAWNGNQQCSTIATVYTSSLGCERCPHANHQHGAVVSKPCSSMVHLRRP